MKKLLLLVITIFLLSLDCITLVQWINEENPINKETLLYIFIVLSIATATLAYKIKNVQEIKK